MTQEPKKIWLKAETYSGELRTLLTPQDAARLISCGIPVYVEKSSSRIFPDTEYAAAGCKLVEAGTWNSPAARNSIVLAVKYLDKVDRLDPAFPIKDRILIHWAHSFDFDPGEQLEIARLEDTSITVPALHGKTYKPSTQLLPDDAGYRHNLSGLHALHTTNLLDLEVIRNADGSRLLDGYNAGLSGAACALFVWINKYFHRPADTIPRPFESVDSLVERLKTELSTIPQNEWPRCGVLGTGRAGAGAARLFTMLGIQHDSFSRANTKDAEAFGKHIVSYDIALNCTCLTNNHTPLITDETLLHNQSLSVIGDISSYPTLGILRFHQYTHERDWNTPTLRVQHGDKPVDIVSIDNLPNLIAKPVSVALSSKLVDALLHLSKHSFSSTSLHDFFGIPEAIAQQHLDLAAHIKDLAFSLSIACFQNDRFNERTAKEMLRSWLADNSLSPDELRLFKGYFVTGFAQVYDIRNQSYDNTPNEAVASTQLAILDSFTEALDIQQLYSQSHRGGIHY